MKSSLLTLVAVASLLAVSAPAMAADLAVDVPVVDDGGFSWDGAYVGGFLGYFPTFPAADVGGEVGYNWLLENNMLVGIEGSGLFYLDGSGDSELFVRGKVGTTFDRVALYAMGGLGIYEMSLPLWDVGVGVEVALTDNVSWNAQIFGREEVGNLPDVPHVQTGLRFHF